MSFTTSSAKPADTVFPAMSVEADHSYASQPLFCPEEPSTTVKASIDIEPIVFEYANEFELLDA